MAARGGTSSAKKILFGFGSIVLAILLIWAGVKFASWDKLPKIGDVATQTPISAPSWVATALGVGLGIEQTGITWENIIIHLAIFMIIFFAMSEIVAGFSSFSETVSWVIGLGMALIAGATKIIYLLASVMGITAGIGAVGIMIIILAAIGAAVILNLGIGGSMRTWRMKRQVDIKKHKVAQGFETAAAGVRGAKTLAEAGAEGEE